MAADSQNGNVNNFSVFLGKEANVRRANSLGYDIVMKMASPFLKMHRHIFSQDHTCQSFSKEQRRSRNLHSSNTTLCLQHLEVELGVKRSRMSFALTTINAEGTQCLGQEVSLTVKGLKLNDYIHLDRVWTVNNPLVLKKSNPRTEDIRDWPQLKGISSPTL